MSTAPAAPVVLIHPWGSTGATTWTATQQALSLESHRVLAVDLPGHGGRGGEAFSWEAAVEVVAEAVDRLGGEPAVLIGLSLGAAVALRAARDQPHLVRGLVLSGAGACWADWRVQLSLRALGRIAAGLGAFGRWEPLARANGHRGHAVSVAAAQIAGSSPRQLVRAADQLAAFDARSWPRLDVPSVTLVFTEDRRMPPGLQRALARGLRGHSIDVVADHDAPVRSPDRFHSAVREAFDVLAELNAIQPQGVS